MNDNAVVALLAVALLTGACGGGGGLGTPVARFPEREAIEELAAEEAMQRVSQSERRAIGGYVLETSSLQVLMFGDDLLGARAPEVEVGVTHYKAQGGAWGQYVLLVLVRDVGALPSQTAMTNGSRGSL